VGSIKAIVESRRGGMVAAQAKMTCRRPEFFRPHGNEQPVNRNLAHTGAEYSFVQARMGWDALNHGECRELFALRSKMFEDTTRAP
jgi:hypothetical protein